MKFNTETTPTDADTDADSSTSKNNETEELQKVQQQQQYEQHEKQSITTLLHDDTYAAQYLTAVCLQLQQQQLNNNDDDDQSFAYTMATATATAMQDHSDDGDDSDGSDKINLQFEKEQTRKKQRKRHTLTKEQLQEGNSNSNSHSNSKLMEYSNKTDEKRDAVINVVDATNGPVLNDGNNIQIYNKLLVIKDDNNNNNNSNISSDNETNDRTKAAAAIQFNDDTHGNDNNNDDDDDDDDDNDPDKLSLILIKPINYDAHNLKENFEKSKYEIINATKATSNEETINPTPAKAATMVYHYNEGENDFDEMPTIDYDETFYDSDYYVEDGALERQQSIDETEIVIELLNSSPTTTTTTTTTVYIPLETTTSSSTRIEEENQLRANAWPISKAKLEISKQYHEDEATSLESVLSLLSSISSASASASASASTSTSHHHFHHISSPPPLHAAFVHSNYDVPLGYLRWLCKRIHIKLNVTQNTAFNVDKTKDKMNATTISGTNTLGRRVTCYLYYMLSSYSPFIFNSIYSLYCVCLFVFVCV